MITNETKRTAAETYAARRTDIARLIDVLEMELDNLDQRAAAEPERWDLAGTAGHVRDVLIGLVAGLSHTDREGVENFRED